MLADLDVLDSFLARTDCDLEFELELELSDVDDAGLDADATASDIEWGPIRDEAPCPLASFSVESEVELVAAELTPEQCYLRIPAAVRPMFRSGALSLVTVQALETLLLDELDASSDPEPTISIAIESSFHRRLFHGIAAYYGLRSFSHDNPLTGARITTAVTNTSPWSLPPCSLVHTLLARASARHI
ncbi:uncharacterized protein AMSG_06871 [Thecamonas trahens ATCC 50062]|uniref:R3H domain-containing protein n=1 Tax=Thecamonas trahens ATCC 50062 TaxID=461836 RepID=A0A0L0DDF4_THETB|nr:hypothetical protein AMSG_06871 [Thecamonas trahens ATCC 50062]KNC50382.1 hypothetical protein AMSG_06871 [Thecamonas trahens ATCC 50062]|eukprot:XP_013756924.1 hypothetical protein AMSG_06871 [Thecamonas trahens ATCC 50062]